jgi:hypothetical protein
MTAATRVRWECPTGRHPSKLGPRRPRLDDVVRYCLPCSEGTGRLVQRIAPALERARAAGVERAKARSARRRQSDATARQRAVEAETERYTIEGVDLRDEVKRLCRLRAFGGSRGPLARRPPRFHVAVRQQHPRSLYGTAWPDRWEFHIIRYPGITLADVRETIVHELAHLVAGYDRSDARRWHGERWRQLMRRAFAEAYGPDVIAPPNRYHGHYAAALRRRDNLDGGE